MKHQIIVSRGMRDVARATLQEWALPFTECTTWLRWRTTFTVTCRADLAERVEADVQHAVRERLDFVQTW